MSKSIANIITCFKKQPIANSRDHRRGLRCLAIKLEKAALDQYGRRLSGDCIFYVYVYLNPLKPGKYSYKLRTGETIIFDYEPLYVGKGRNRRYRNHVNLAGRILRKRATGARVNADYKTNIITSILETGQEPIILRSNRVTEAEAMAGEIIYIDGIGRRRGKLGPLANLTDGGDGVSGMEHSKENAPVQNMLLTVNGVKRTLREWSEITGIAPGVLRHRINKGVAEHRILASGTVRPKAKKLTANGLSLTVSEWMARSGLTRKAINRRLNRGLTHEQAVDPHFYDGRNNWGLRSKGVPRPIDYR